MLLADLDYTMQERIQKERPQAIILSGGPNSVHIANAPQLPKGFCEYVQQERIPVLGVCYGMQLLVYVSSTLPPQQIAQPAEMSTT